MNFEEWKQNYQKKVEFVLSELYGQVHPTIKNEVECAVQGGKRYRPLLCLGVAESYGAALSAKTLALSCVAELIHKASLVQDDLMDNTDTRSGRPALHAASGSAIAVLTSVHLLTMAYDLLKQDLLNFPRLQQAVMLTIQAMVAGQAHELKLKRDGVRPNVLELRAIRRNKTGALYDLATFMGGVMAGASDEILVSLQTWGASLGEANQIADDLMDGDAVTDDEERLRIIRENLYTDKPELRELATWISA